MTNIITQFSKKLRPEKKLYCIIRGIGLYTSFKNIFRYGNGFDLTHPPLSFRVRA
jgi:hypothetical protein